LNNEKNNNPELISEINNNQKSLNVNPSFTEDINYQLTYCKKLEENFLKTQYKIPYLVYFFLLFILISTGIIIIFISKIYNININYLEIFVTSSIVFALIASYAIILLWFTLNQSYSLNIENELYKELLISFESSN